MICAQFLFSLLAGVVSGLVVYILIEIFKKRNIKKDMEKYEGQWKSYPLGKNHLPYENELRGIIEIKIFKGYTLTFMHQNKIKGRESVNWDGKIIINREYHQTGRMIWQYLETSTYTDIGIKEIVLKEMSDCYLLYLIPVNINQQNYDFGVWKKMK